MTYLPSLRAVLPENILREDEEVAHFPLQVTDVRITPSDACFVRRLH
jgi:hypothetical protein